MKNEAKEKEKKEKGKKKRKEKKTYYLPRRESRGMRSEFEGEKSSAGNHRTDRSDRKIPAEAG